ncbi:MAG: EAL domain-containing protein [Bdellovibrionales bacterium]|nr:EAL domain-containing protein [Bdellovibrionales bacterium]
MTTNYKNKLVDEYRGLSSYLTHLPELEEILEREKALGVIYIDGRHLSTIENRYGTSYFDEVMQKVSHSLLDMRGHTIRKKDLITLTEVQGYSFLIFLSEGRKESGRDVLLKEDVEFACERVQKHLQHNLFLELYNYLHGLPKISVGYSLVLHNPMVAKTRTILHMIDEARNISALHHSQNELRRRGRLQKILLEENVKTLYQPIIDIKNQNIFAFEALSRGPKNSEIEAPIILFTLAEEIGLLYDLDRLCRRRAIVNAKGKPAGKKLFVNTLPNLIFDPEFGAKAFVEFLGENNIPIGDVVFEITERNAIEQFGKFKKALKYYIDAGIEIAIDDVGAGYSSLEAIVEIKPTFVKIDASVIRGLHESEIKRQMLKALIMLSKSIDAKIVAEGVENKKDLEVLVDYQIDYAQGYYFARPAPPFPTVTQFS